MRSSLFLPLFLAPVAGCDSGPGSTNEVCADLCEKQAECAGASNTSVCTTECESNIESVSSECKDPILEMGACMTDLDCEDLEGLGILTCVPDDMPASCLEALSSGDEDCCVEGDPCDWADDGFCDCDDEQAWDANDCS